MCPGEGGSGGSGGSGTGLGDGGGPGDIAAILAYLNHWTFGTNGDYTRNVGYGGDKFNPTGYRVPDQTEDRGEPNDVLLAPPERPDAPSERWRDIEPYAGAPVPSSGLYAFARGDVDPFTGRPLGGESPDPFTGLPAADPFLDTGPPQREAAPFAAIRRASLLSSPYLLADNGAIVCDPARTSCLPEKKSDANQSSVMTEVWSEMDQSFAAILQLQQGTAKVAVDTETDMQQMAAKAAQVTQSDEYKLAYTVNQLRDHPIEIRHSAVLTGLGHMASGGITAGAAGLMVLGSDGLLLPLAGAMGLGSGIAQFSSGLALAASGADSTETVRISGQLDYVFALTASPAGLAFGTTGLMISGGDVDVSHRFAIAGDAAEGMMQFRGDPSKLYSAVIPGVGTKAEKGASALLIKDVAALGYTAQAKSVDVVATKLSRDFTVDDLKAIAAFREQLATTGRLDLAGVAGHEAAGAAPRGVDFVRYGGAFIQDLKLHGPYTFLDQWYLDKAATQTLNYSIKYQMETRALGEQLVPIRSTKHMWISPTEAVKFVE